VSQGRAFSLFRTRDKREREGFVGGRESEVPERPCLGAYSVAGWGVREERFGETMAWCTWTDMDAAAGASRVRVGCELRGWLRGAEGVGRKCTKGGKNQVSHIDLLVYTSDHKRNNIFHKCGVLCLLFSFAVVSILGTRTSKMREKQR
jgi:hypothetical protein